LITAKEQKDSSSSKLDTCPVCGQPIFRILKIESLGINRKVAVLCECKKKELDEKQAKHEAYQKQIRLQAMFANSMMTKENKNKTFEKWRHDVGDEKMFVIGTRYVDKFDEMKKKNLGLMIFGGTGNGKTFLTSCIANALLSKGQSVVCITATGIMDKIKDSYNNYGDSGVQGILNNLNSAELVIIDDLGTEQDTKHNRGMMYQIINDRYARNKPLIATTNLSVKQLQSRYDGEEGAKRTYSRLVEMCSFIHSSGKDIRERKGEAKTKYLNGLLEG